MKHSSADKKKSFTLDSYMKCIYYDYGMFYLRALSDLPNLVKIDRSLAFDFSERWIQF